MFERRKAKVAFKKVLKEFGVKHAQMPPMAPTWQSDVEAFHKIIEDEFYDIEDYENLAKYYAKVLCLRALL